MLFCHLLLVFYITSDSPGPVSGFSLLALSLAAAAPWEHTALEATHWLVTHFSTILVVCFYLCWWLWSTVSQVRLGLYWISPSTAQLSHSEAQMSPPDSHRPLAPPPQVTSVTAVQSTMISTRDVCCCSTASEAQWAAGVRGMKICSAPSDSLSNPWNSLTTFKLSFWGLFC